MSSLRWQASLSLQFLELLSPSVAAEFDAERNSFAPIEVTAVFHMVIWWRNAQRGSWSQAVNIRVDKRYLPETSQVKLC